MCSHHTPPFQLQDLSNKGRSPCSKLSLGTHPLQWEGCEEVSGERRFIDSLSSKISGTDAKRIDTHQEEMHVCRGAKPATQPQTGDRDVRPPFSMIWSNNTSRRHASTISSGERGHGHSHRRIEEAKGREHERTEACVHFVLDVDSSIPSARSRSLRESSSKQN